MDNIHTETRKSLTTAESRNKEFALKLATGNRDWRSAEAGLRITEA